MKLKLQMSKLIESREDWRKKAVERATKIREFRKAEKRHLEKIARLEAKIVEMEQIPDDKKK